MSASVERTTTATGDARWLTATYRVQSSAEAIDARAAAIALEQSVELPREAVTDARVLQEVVARVASIRAVAATAFDVTIELAVETTGGEAGQVLNMLFGNTSLHADVALVDVDVPDSIAKHFGGPRFGIDGLRALTGAEGRALTCSALKPQGLSSSQLATLAGVFARAGIDVVKDDHGLADQAAAPFAARVRDVQRAIDEANRETGRRCVYAPSLTGHYAQMREQLAVARAAGVAMLMLAPMVSGVASLAALADEARMPILAHPSLAGTTRIRPATLMGRLFRLFGADATIFPNAGGRFGFTPQQCGDIADAARAPWRALRPALPVPAGGMTLARVPGVCTQFGNDTMLLVGGSLLAGDGDVASRCRAFVAAVAASGASR